MQVKQSLNREYEELLQDQNQRTVFRAAPQVKQEIADLRAQIAELDFHLTSQKKLRGEDVASINIQHKR